MTRRLGSSRTLSRRTLFAVGAGSVLTAFHETAVASVASRPRRNRRRRPRAQVAPPAVDSRSCDRMTTSGIVGLVLIGPMCPVMTLDDPCPDRPFAATIFVRDAEGRFLCEAASGDDGRFTIGLTPGSYQLDPVDGPAGLPYAVSQLVTVLPGQYTEVTIGYDSGIR